MKKDPAARKTSQSQMNATRAYYAKALENVNVLLSPYDREVFEALQVIKAHHGGNRASAVKAAIMHYAQSLNTQ